MSAAWWGNQVERGRIPPDEPENYLVDTEYGDGVIRNSYKDGATDWQVQDVEHDCVHQDAMETAYALGMAAMEAQNKRLRETAYGKGVVDAAITAYGGRHRRTR